MQTRLGAAKADLAISFAALIDVTSDFEYEQDQMMRTTGGESVA